MLLQRIRSVQSLCVFRLVPHLYFDHLKPKVHVFRTFCYTRARISYFAYMLYMFEKPVHRWPSNRMPHQQKGCVAHADSFSVSKLCFLNCQSYVSLDFNHNKDKYCILPVPRTPPKGASPGRGQSPDAKVSAKPNKSFDMFNTADPQNRTLPEAISAPDALLSAPAVPWGLL